MKIRGKDLRLSMEYGHGWSLTISLDDASVPAAKQACDTLTDVSADLKQYRPNRSLDANNYAWVLIGKIAVATRQSKIDVYRHAVRDLGDNYEFICVADRAAETFQRAWSERGDGWLCEQVPCKLTGCKKFQIYYGSSVYDSGLMSAFIDRLIADAKDLGIETMTPREIDELKVKWNG